MAITQRPLALSANLEPVTSAAWKTVPVWDLITTADRAIPPDAQRAMARRADAHVTEVASSHAVMVSHPQAVIDIIVAADENTRGARLEYENSSSSRGSPR
jgi:pimeloyl-ACP methyl ester carboxylesterase